MNNQEQKKLKMNYISDLDIEEVIQQNNCLVKFQGQYRSFQSTQIVKLDFRKTILEKKILLDQFLRILKNTTELKIFSVIIQSYQIQNQEILSLCECIKSNKQMLELEIQLDDCNLNNNQIQNLTISFYELTQLKKLIFDVSESSIQSNGLIFIGKAIQNLPYLIHLNLNVWYCQIQLEGFIQFAKYLTQLKSLRVLIFKFGWNLFDDIQEQYVKNSLKKQKRIVNCVF
ncbi:hypothetical protein ABPG74_015396 [Tetrahymena malaccensis]